MFPCEIKEFADRPILSMRLRSSVGDLPQHLAQVYGAISSYMKSTGIISNGPAFAAYYNMDMTHLDVEAGFMLMRPAPAQGEISASTVPAGIYAVCHYTGGYEGIRQVYGELQKFVAERGYTVSGAPIEWYLNGPETPPQDLKTDVEFPVLLLRETAHA